MGTPTRFEQLGGWWWNEDHKGALRHREWFAENHQMPPAGSDEYQWIRKVFKKCLTEGKLAEYDALIKRFIPLFERWVDQKKPFLPQFARGLKVQQSPAT